MDSVGIIEHHVKRFYESINISDPSCLSIEYISSKINVEVYYWERASSLIDLKSRHSVFINSKLSERGQWQDFGHEMKHYFYDGGSQVHLTKSFRYYQEVKADYFAYHFCVPTFMLQQLKEVNTHDIARIFNVEFDFALRRLDMYKSSVIAAAESSVIYR